MTTDPQPHNDFRIVKTEMFDADMMFALGDHDGVPTDIKKILKAYRKRATDGNKVQVVYEFGSNWKGIQKGRIGPQKGLGLQTFRSDIRAALAAKYYWDIDIANAQPNILVALCKERGWKCDLLEEYTLNRSSKLAELMTDLDCDRDAAKQFCLSILFGAQPYKNVSAYYTQLAAELSTIAENCLLAFPEITKVAKSRDNPKASCIAVVAQDKEREILTELDRFLRTLGRIMDALIHDGGLVRKEDGELCFPPEILRAAEDHLAAKFGFRLRLEVKPMKHSFVVSESKIIPSSVVVNDAYAAQRFVEFLGNNIALDKSGIRYIFDTVTGLWSPDETTLKRWLNVLGEKMVFKQMSATGVMIHDYLGKEKNIQAMIKNIDRHLEATDFVSQRAESSIGKLLFADGVFNIDTLEFTEGFNPNYFFFGRIHRPFPETRNDELINHVEKLLFVDPYLEDQKEQAKFYKIGLARALYGDYRAKRCYVTVGEPNCGRGLLTGALASAFGDYVSTFDSNNLLYNPRDGADSAKQNAWLVPIANTRLAIGNEIRLTGTRFIDGNKLKSIASGGDVIKGRLNHKDESPFVFRSTLLVQLNDLGTIKPADQGVLNRLCVNELKKSYTLTPETGNPRQMLQDNSLKSKFDSIEYQDALFYVMIEAWLEFVKMGRVYEKPACIVSVTGEWVETGASIFSLLEDKYEITKDENDWVVTRDLIQHLRDKGCVETDTKIGRQLTAKGCVDHERKVNGAKKHVRTGIRRIPETEAAE